MVTMSQEGRKKLTSGAEAPRNIFQCAPLAASFALSTVMTLKYLFLKDLAGNSRNNRPEIRANLLIYKYFTSKSLFLKDMAKHQR